MRVMTDHVYRCRIPTPSNEVETKCVAVTVVKEYPIGSTKIEVVPCLEIVKGDTFTPRGSSSIYTIEGVKRSKIKTTLTIAGVGLTEILVKSHIIAVYDSEETPVYVHLKAVKQPEYDGFMQEAQAKLASMEKDKWAEYNKTQMLDICRSKVVKVEGLFVDGVEVGDFDTFYANAPMDMASWVLSAILSEQMLMSNEVKNSEPV